MSVEKIVSGGVEFYRSDLVSEAFASGFSTRVGGVSEGYLASLNLGVHRGDKSENVVENYRRFGAAVGFRPENTVFTHQVHGVNILRVGKSDCGTGLFREQTVPCDGLMTDEPDVALTVFSADCTPILLCDPRTGAVCAVHAGWRGTAAGIAACAVRKMAETYGSRPADLVAVIGPCIDKCCFETDRDVPDAMAASLGAAADFAITRAGNGKYHVDLKKLNLLWLRQSGVANVDISEECTCCHPDVFWSHRQVGGERGSLAAVIMRRG